MAVPLDQSPVLWLDADDTGTVTTSTGVVTWADKSGLGNDFTQPFSSSFEPAYQSSAINGRHAIRFAGTKFLYRADDSDLHLTGDFSVFFVVTFSAVAKGGAAQNTIMSRNFNKWEFSEYQANNTGFVNGTGTGVGSATLTTSTTYIVEWHRDGSNNVTATLNDVADLSTSISGDNTAAQEVIIGTRPSGSPDLYLQGDIGEILLFDSMLDSTDRDAVYDYLAARWLPASDISLPLSPATVTVTPVAPARTVGTAEVPLSPATVTVTAQELSPAAGQTVALTPATITVTPTAPGVTTGSVDVPLSPATVTVTPSALTASIDGANYLALTPAVVTVTGQALDRTSPTNVYGGTVDNGSTVPGGTITPPDTPPVWAFTVHDPTTNALKGTISGALERSGWEDVWSDAGAGTLLLAADDPGLAFIDRGDVIRCAYQGHAAFQWRATRSAYDRTSDDAGVITWAGPGRLADLSAVRIAPSRGEGARPVEETRSFGWPSVDYDDSTWVFTSVSLGQMGTPTDYWYGLGDWPAPSAEWMWAPGASQVYSRTGDVFFRTTFTVDSPGWHTVYLAVDDRGSLWIDGQRLVTTQSWDNTNGSIATAKLVLSAGEHTIAVWGNNNPGEVGNNPAGALVSIMPEGGGASILNSGAGWKCYPYPIVPPGIRFGYVIDRLLSDAQADGLLAGLTWDFTDAVDSDGVPWPWLGDVTAKVGSDLWALIKAHAGIDCQVHMPGAAYRLDLYVPDGGGTTRAITLDFPTDENDPTSGAVVEQHNRAEGTVATAAWVRWDGGWLYVDTTPDGAEKFETLLELTHIVDETEARRTATAELANLAQVREEIEVDVEPVAGELPWIDWTVGDTVTARNTAGDLVDERVVGIAAQIDGDELTITPTIKDRIAEDLERHEEWLKSMADGAARGQAGSVTPPVLLPPPVPARQVTEQGWSLPKWKPFTGGRHEFNSRRTTRRWRLDLDDVATGTCTAVIRYEGGSTIATATVTAGNKSASVVVAAVIDNGQAVEVVTTGTEAFGGNATLEYL